MSHEYPEARRLPLVEKLHGIDVADPFRWLEDDESGETRAWVAAQNLLTRRTLDTATRERLAERLRRHYDYPRTLSLAARGGRYFFTHNPGLLDQPLLYVQDGHDAEPRVLIDPNALSADGTTAMTAYFPSPDGSRIAYAMSVHGSDRQVLHVREVNAPGQTRQEHLEFVKFASVAWTAAGDAFFYLRFPEPGSVPPEDEQYFGRIYLHRLGEPQAADALVFQHPQREVVPLVQVSSRGDWLVVTAQRGASDDAEVYVAELRQKADAAPRLRPLFQGFSAAYEFIDEVSGRLLFRTTADAPMGRIVSVDPRRPEEGVLDLVPEGPDRLSLIAVARHRIVAAFLHNASDRLRTFAFDGSPRGEIPLPGIGSIVSLDADVEDDEVRFVYTSFTEPAGAWVARGDAASRFSGVDAATAWRTPGMGGPSDGSAPRPDASDRYRTTQVWYPSKDGTRISMFLVHRNDVAPDGSRPVLLSGYGGFNISRTPLYDPGNLPLLEDGGVFALANLRGGGEYGESWHRAGMLEHKQNVFDDFVAAAEYLVASGWTSASRIAIEGGSNGGLLVGAVMLQRPDAFGAVVCRVPVADMLRYHLFTVGRFWIPEYGSADDPNQFEYLLRYSPYHNVRGGVRYPPALVMTADTDDRVAPGMARKFAARLQADGEGGPFLIRVEMKAGHGAGKPVAKLIDEDADILAFVYGYVFA